MDYEKKYKEALERARQIQNTPYTAHWDVMKEVVEYIFPNLAESEDERIKKSLKRVIASFHDCNFPTPEGFTRKELFAWLEKQGEHANFRNKIQIGDKVTRNEDGVLVNLSQLNRVAKKDEKQGEHKETLCDKCKKEQPSHSCQDITALGRCALEKQGEQKPMKTCAEYYNKNSEWKMPELSVFQNKLADILMQREYEGSTETEEDVARARLDYELAAIRISEELLPLVIMQKPAEWSEEDERIKNNLLSELTNLSVRKLIEKETEKKYANWLKSLRPQSQWKPSEEMLEALYKVIPQNVMAISEDEMLLDKLYQGLKYGRVLSKN